MKEISHPLISVELRVIKRFPRGIFRLITGRDDVARSSSDHAGEILKHLPHIVEHYRQHPRTSQNQSRKQHQKLGDKRQRHFIDLRGRLEYAYYQARHQRRQKKWSGDHQRNLHGILA
jgi:hypothetical protein